MARNRTTEPGRPVGRLPMMAGNWKMNLNHLEALAAVQKLAFALEAEDYAAVEVVVLPPFTDLRSVQTLIAGDKLTVRYGAQDLSPHPDGAHTGDVSGAMLAKLSCSYVVVGHSERRQHHHEDDEVVAAKVAAAYIHGIVPILCVGEELAIRDAGEQVAYCTAQLDGALGELTAEQVAQLVLAYEPIWAIGTGRTASPDDAQEVCAALRARLAQRYDEPVAEQVRVLYGGSVTSANVAAMMGEADVDGALVGGASLDAQEFARIVRYRRHLQLPRSS